MRGIGDGKREGEVQKNVWGWIGNNIREGFGWWRVWNLNIEKREREKQEVIPNKEKSKHEIKKNKRKKKRMIELEKDEYFQRKKNRTKEKNYPNVIMKEENIEIRRQNVVICK